MKRTSIALLFLTILPALGRAQTSDSSPLLITPGKVDFGSRQLGSPDQPVNIIVKNPSDTPITLESVIASGIDFAPQNHCPGQLPPQSTCTIAIEFKPAIAGSRTGLLVILAGRSSNPYYVPLSGTGVESIAPERSGAGGSLPSLDRHEDLASEEKRQSPVESSRIGPAQRRKRGGRSDGK